MALVTLEQTQRHLHLPITEDDPDLQDKIDQATDLILQYLERPSDADWTATLATWGDTADTPGPVVAAILVQTGELYRWRGDDNTDARPTQDLSPLVRAYLGRYKDPVLA